MSSRTDSPRKWCRCDEDTQPHPLRGRQPSHPAGDRQRVHRFDRDRPPFQCQAELQRAAGVERAAKQKFDDRWRWDDVTDEWHDVIAADHPAVKELIEAAVVIEGGTISAGKVTTGVTDSIAAFIAWMAPRVVEMRRVLKPSGGLYMHCDDAANSYLRLLLDAVFGRNRFRNEIIWKRTKGKGLNPTKYLRNCDRILYYAKSAKPTWNQHHVPHDPSYGSKWRKDERGPWEAENPDRRKSGRPGSL